MKMEAVSVFRWIIYSLCVNGIICHPGRQFLVVFPQSYADDKYNNYVTITCMPESSAEVQVIYNFPEPLAVVDNVTLTLMPNERYRLTVPKKMNVPIGTLIDKRTLQINSTNDIVVAVFNRQSSNGDAYLAMPNDLLGREFFSTNYEPRTPGASFITMATSHDDVNISVVFPKSPKDIQISYNGRLFTSGDSISVTLHANQVFQIQALQDLTGSHIVSDKPIIVFSGVNRTSVHYQTCFSHMEDLVPSVDRLGNEYITLSEPEYLLHSYNRILATEPSTRVTIAGQQTVTFNTKGEFYDLTTEPNTFYFIESNKPIQVAYMSWSPFNATRRIHDSSLIILTPQTAAQNFYTFSVPYYNNIYVVVVIEAIHASGLLLNNRNVTTNWMAVSGKPSHVVGKVKITTATSASHNISHGDGERFVAYVIGTAKCEAYGFPLTYLESSNHPSCKNSESVPGDGVDNDCDGKIDEEICCNHGEKTDEDGDGLFDEDCLAPPGYILGKDICCDSSLAPYICQPRKRWYHSKAMEGKKYASEVEDVSVGSKFLCHLKCLSVTGCWGFNFRRTPGSDADDNCQILKNTPNGLSIDNEWLFYNLEKDEEF